MAISGAAILLAVVLNAAGAKGRSARGRDIHLLKKAEVGRHDRHSLQSYGSDTDRRLPDRLDNPLKSAVLSWESLLVLVAIGIFIANSLRLALFPQRLEPVAT